MRTFARSAASVVLGSQPTSDSFGRLAGASPVLRAGVMACKERVLALKGDGAAGALDGVAVHLDPAISQEQDQAVPVFGDVLQGFTRWGFGRDLRT